MIAIIGGGNVATHLYEAFKSRTQVCLVNPRTLEGLPDNPEIILISVSDNAIAELIEKLPQSNAIIAHTAGSIPIDILKRKFKNTGVFYPLQTFTKGVPLDYSEIPVFIEGSSYEVVEKLKTIASLVSNIVTEADSEKSKTLHLASVFACNFTNALAGISYDILKDSEIDFKVLLPLMQQTVSKLREKTPREAQTGPAVRKDTKVMEAHLKMLDGSPDKKEIYSLLSDYIVNLSNK